MAKVKIYQFWIYDVIADERRVSRRWGTLAGIQSNTTGVPMIETEIEVNEEAVLTDHPGLTERNFNPRRRLRGFPALVE